MDGQQIDRRRLIASIALLSAFGRVAWTQTEVNVVTARGRLRGALSASGICVFKGIPYGAATGGENRFMPPRPAESWTGVRDAFAYGHNAPQVVQGPNGPFPDLPQSEDCLVLNVWTPSMDRTAKKPVMVWLHGGAFATGSGSAVVHDGTNLSRIGDVVVVTLNHRLNVFGYTYLARLGGAAFADSGNIGQLDILQALAWVQENIEAFGGDPRNVTIFGQSGGGMKVITLMAMPRGKGLFHRAISESGPGLFMAEADAQDQAARALLAEVNLSQGDVRGLQRVPAADLLRAYDAVGRRVVAAGPAMIRTFAPTIDGGALPQHPFAPSAPAVSAGVPLIIGYTRTETIAFPPGGTKLDLAETDLVPRLSPILGTSTEAVVEAFRQAMPQASPWDLLIRISTEAPWGAYSRQIALRKTAAGHAPAYFYRFDWETQVGHQLASHAMEVPFVFSNTQAAAGRLGLTPGQSALAGSMSRLWASFARTGRPSAPGMPAWPPYDQSRATLVINDVTERVDDPDRPLRLAIDRALHLPA